LSPCKKLATIDKDKRKSLATKEPESKNRLPCHIVHTNANAHNKQNIFLTFWQGFGYNRSF
ncbi:hypothetical protein, partial [Helicobacter sp. 'CLO3_human']